MRRILLLSLLFVCFNTTQGLAQCTSPATSAITGPTCSTNGATGLPYSVINTPGSSYAWTVTLGAIVSGTGTNNITVNWGALVGVGSVQVTETNSLGCVGAVVSLNVSLQPQLPIFIISGSNSACSNGIAQYSVPFFSGYTYDLTIVGGTQVGTMSTIGGNNYFSVNWGAVGSGNIGLTISNGCSSKTASLPVTINPCAPCAPPTTSAINGANIVCANTAYPYNVINTVGSAYVWTITGGTLLSSSGNQAWVQWNSSGPGNVSVVETTSGSGVCVGSPVNLSVTVNSSLAPFTITGPNISCAYVNGVVYSVPNVPGVTYNWSVADGTIVSGANTNSVTVNWGSDLSKETNCWGPCGQPPSISVIETNSVGCQNSAWMSVTLNKPSVGVSPFVSNICPGGTATLIPSSGGTWTSNNPAAATVTNSGLVTGVAPGLGSFSFTESSSGCKNTINLTIDPTVITITLQPSPSVEACLNASSIISVAASGGTQIRWYSNTVNSNTGGTQYNGPSSATTSIGVPTTTVGTIYYYAVFSNSCTSVSSNVSAVTVGTSLPSVTAQPSLSPQTSCQSAVTPLSVSATTSWGSLNYQWYRSSTATPGASGSSVSGVAISGANGSSYTPSILGTNYYWVVVSNSCGQVYSNISGAITINSSTSISNQPISASQTFCQNASVTPLSVTVAGAGLSYQWFSNLTNSNTGGAPISGTNSSSFVPPTSAAGTTYYYVVVTGACGSATSNVSGAITIKNVPNPVIIGNSPVCANTNGVTYSVTNNMGSTYNWSVTGGSLVSGQGTSTITVNWGAMSLGTVSVTETNTGCSTTVNKSITINPLPVTGTITGPSPVCANTSGVIYSVTNTAGSNYAWTVIGTGSSLVSGNGTNSIIVNWGTGTGTVKVVETSAAVCVGSMVTKTVTINALPTTSLVITGSTTQCPNAPGTAYSATFTTGSTYNWSITGGTKATGGTTNAITINWGLGGPGNVRVVETNLAGCVGTTFNKPVTVSPLTTPINGSIAVCPNSNGVAYSVANVTGNNYTWTATGGTVVCGQNTSTILVNWGATGSGTLNVTERSATCTGVAVSLPVAITPSPATSAITGSSAVCANSTAVSYSVTNTSGSTYAWTVSGGILMSGNGTNSIIVNWGIAGTGNVSVVETSGTGCIGTAVNKTISITSVTTGIITGSSSMCLPANGVTYSVANTAGSTYVWTINGGNMVSGAGTNSITVNWTLAGPGLVSVVETNSAGCIGNAVTQPVQVNSKPATSAITGNNSVCPNASGVSYSVTNTPGSTYVWTISGGTQASGGNSNNITVNWGATGTGNVSVLETNNFGCIGLAVNLPTTINTLPTITVSPASATINYGGSVSLTASGASTYSWSPPTGLNTTTGATVAASPSVSTTYTVTGTDSRGCVNTKTVPVSLTCTPPSVFIGASNGLNLCKVSSTTLTATAISGATYTWTSSYGDYSKTGTTTNGGNTLLVYDEETYTVTVNVSGCIGSASTTTYRTGTLCNAIARVAPGSQPTKPTESEDELKGHKISVHPNPANHEVIVETPWRAEHDTQVVLYDMMGRVSGSGILKKGEWTVTISTAEVANGMYVVRIGTGNEANAEKVIIEHK